MEEKRNRRKERVCDLLGKAWKVKQLPAHFHSVGNLLMQSDGKNPGHDCQKALTCTKASCQLGTACSPKLDFTRTKPWAGLKGGDLRACPHFGKLPLQESLSPPGITQPLFPEPGATDALAEEPGGAAVGEGARPLEMALSGERNSPAACFGKRPEHCYMSHGLAGPVMLF